MNKSQLPGRTTYPPRMRRTLWLLLWVAAGCRGPVAAVPGHASVAYVEARENEAGVAGAPVDETDFEFEPDP